MKNEGFNGEQLICLQVGQCLRICKGRAWEETLEVEVFNPTWATLIWGGSMCCYVFLCVIICYYVFLCFPMFAYVFVFYHMCFYVSTPLWWATTQLATMPWQMNNDGGDQRSPCVQSSFVSLTRNCTTNRHLLTHHCPSGGQNIDVPLWFIGYPGISSRSQMETQPELSSVNALSRSEQAIP